LLRKPLKVGWREEDASAPCAPATAVHPIRRAPRINYGFPTNDAEEKRRKRRKVRQLTRAARRCGQNAARGVGSSILCGSRKRNAERLD